MGQRILVVDDEEKILEVVDSYLSHSGYSVSLARNGRDALDAWRFYHPDLVILDLMLPDMSGEEVCRAIRREADTPVLMLTAKSSEEAMLRGFALGSDDYLCKPFSPRVLVARVQALLKRHYPENPAGPAKGTMTSARGTGRGDTAGGPGNGGLQGAKILKSHDGRLVLDTRLAEVRFDGARLALTTTEFRLLELFLDNPGRVFSRDSLVGALLEDPAMVDPRTMDAHIKNLRHKLGEGPRPPEGRHEKNLPSGRTAQESDPAPAGPIPPPLPHEPYIQTVHGMGYRFSGGQG